MSNTTAEQHLKSMFMHKLTIKTSADEVKTYGDLRAKEAVKEFAEELIGSGAMYYGQVPAISVNEVKELAKQKGVEI